MRIELNCRCGISAVFEGNTFINGGGSADANGRVFLVERHADEWHKRHELCGPKKREIGALIEALKKAQAHIIHHHELGHVERMNRTLCCELCEDSTVLNDIAKALSHFPQLEVR